MDTINSSKNAESSEIEKPVADTYHGPEEQVLIILVGLIGSGKVNNNQFFRYTSEVPLVDLLKGAGDGISFISKVQSRRTQR